MKLQLPVAWASERQNLLAQLQTKFKGYQTLFSLHADYNHYNRLFCVVLRFNSESVALYKLQPQQKHSIFYYLSVQRLEVVHIMKTFLVFLISQGRFGNIIEIIQFLGMPKKVNCPLFVFKSFKQNSVFDEFC